MGLMMHLFLENAFCIVFEILESNYVFLLNFMFCGKVEEYSSFTHLNFVMDFTQGQI